MEIGNSDDERILDFKMSLEMIQDRKISISQVFRSRETFIYECLYSNSFYIYPFVLR